MPGQETKNSLQILNLIFSHPPNLHWYSLGNTVSVHSGNQVKTIGFQSLHRPAVQTFFGCSNRDLSDHRDNRQLARTQVTQVPRLLQREFQSSGWWASSYFKVTRVCPCVCSQENLKIGHFKFGVLPLSFWNSFSISPPSPCLLFSLSSIVSPLIFLQGQTRCKFFLHITSFES